MLLLQIQAAILATGKFTNVWMTADPQNWERLNLQNIPDDTVILLSVGEQLLDQPVTVGSGADLTWLNGQLVITLMSRLQLDQAGRDDLFLTDPNIGLLDKLKCVITALQVVDMTDPTSGQYITAEPMRLIKIMPPKKSGLPGWGFASATFEIHWTMNLGC